MLMVRAKRLIGFMTKSLLKTHWPILLDRAMRIIETLPEDTSWTWGGGTALSIRIDHRLSYDIDIFLSNVDIMLLHPSNNKVVKEITKNIQFPGYYVKLLFEEGEIDFLTGSTITTPGSTREAISDHDVPLETTSEIIAKKLHFRGSRALARDVFDLEAARRFAYDDFVSGVKAEPDGARRVSDLIRRKVNRYQKELPLSVNPTDKGTAVLDMDLLDLAGILEEIARGSS